MRLASPGLSCQQLPPSPAPTLNPGRPTLLQNLDVLTKGILQTGMDVQKQQCKVLFALYTLPIVSLCFTMYYYVKLIRYK